MTPALAGYLEATLQAASHPIASTAGEACAPADALAASAHVTQALLDGGVAPHEPVHVAIGNRPTDLAALLGVWHAGAVAVPVHVAAAPLTVEALGRATGARYRVDGASLRQIAVAPAPVRSLLHGAALIIFTSGSTGQPKGVVIGHRRFADKLAVLDRLLKLQADARVLVPLQLTFIFGLWVSLLALRSDARLVMMPKFSASEAAGELAKGCDVLACVPSMLRALLGGGPLSAPGLRAILTGGEPLGAPLAERIGAAVPGAAIYDLYGSTETGSCDFCLGPDRQPGGRGTIGVPTEGVAYRLLGAQGEDILSDGETGELAIKTPYGMLGYLDAPQLTQASSANGFFRTGDLARLRADGCVALVGRAKEIISRGGNKIAPLEIDNLLSGHPDVAAALCAGVPDDRLGEAIHAVVVPRAGAALSQEALRAWLAERIERFKVPDAIHIRDALPAGATGKADRRALAQSILAARLARPDGG